MSQSVTDIILETLKEIKTTQKANYDELSSRISKLTDSVNKRLLALEIANAKITVKIGIRASLIGALSSAIVVIGALLIKLI